jgi:1,2-diacylglycerol 3-alpha-glucosyltransferase
MDGKCMKYDKHILFISPGFASDEADTSTVPYLQDLILGFQKYFPTIKITVIALEYPFKKNKYNWNGINIYPIGGSNKKWLMKVLTFFKAYKKFKIIHRANKIDIVHTFWLGGSTILGDRINRKYDIPHVANAMGQDVLKENKYLKFLNGHYHQALVFNSCFQKEQSKYQHSKSEIISFGIFPDNSMLKQWEAREIDILGVGSLIKLKQFHLFVEAIEKLASQQLIKKAVIVGEGPELKALELLIEKRNLSDIIILVGRKSREEVFVMMNNSKLLLHPSSYESYGYVFVEALQKGMKIISYKVGCAEASEHWKLIEGNAINVYCEDFLKNNPVSKKVELYAVENTIERYLRLYEELSILKN